MLHSIAYPSQVNNLNDIFAFAPEKSTSLNEER